MHIILAEVFGGRVFAAHVCPLMSLLQEARS
jgi:hypothetical protein